MKLIPNSIFKKIMLEHYNTQAAISVGLLYLFLDVIIIDVLDSIAIITVSTSVISHLK